jgi:thioredoxin-related protein
MSFRKYCVIVIGLLIATQATSQGIQWMTWNEAAEANAKQPKKIFVDVYTDWCGWCKRMDQTTFKDSSLVAYMNEHFYAIKLNAEQKESIVWKDFEFAWVAGGRNGYNELAAIILERQMSFPSFVMLDEEFVRIMISPGYKEASAMLKQLQFAKEEIYNTGMTWETYQSKS